MRPGVLPPGLGEMVADLHRRLRALESAPVSGQGVSTFSGTVAVRPTQVGFAGETTALWSSSVGYAWKRQEKQGLALADFDVQLTGDQAIPIDGNHAYPVGTPGWFEPDPLAGGWLFFAGAVSGPGAPATTVTNDPVNGQPATQLTVYPSATITSSAPALQFVVGNNISGGSAGIAQYVYPAGTGGTAAYSETITPTQYVVTYNANGAAAGFSVSESSGDAIVQFTGDVFDLTGITTLDLTGVTVTGLSGASSYSYGSLAAAGSVQGDAAAAGHDGVYVTGADGTKGVILSNTYPDCAVYNASASLLKVYPPSGAQINAQGTDTPLSMSGNAAHIFRRVDANEWLAVRT